MKQRARIKLVQRRQALGRSCKSVVRSKGHAVEHRPRLATIYYEHKELFKRLKDA
jgi:hypothetical protein